MEVMQLNSDGRIVIYSRKSKFTGKGESIEAKYIVIIESKCQLYNHIWDNNPVFLSYFSPKGAKTLGGS